MKYSKWIILGIAAVLVVGVLVALNSDGTPGGLVDGAELSSLAAEGVRVVDVRTAGEFEAGHIPGAENVPLGGLAAAAEGWNPAEPVALYCATGSRSAEGAATLRSLGFETVYDLGGGIARWDGQIEGGSTAVAGTAAPVPTGTPAMYEFYTDW